MNGPKAQAKNTTFWGRCLKEDSLAMYKQLHLVTTSSAEFDEGWQNTACGASGTPGVFRPSKAARLQKCSKCLARERHLKAQAFHQETRRLLLGTAEDAEARAKAFQEKTRRLLRAG